MSAEAPTPEAFPIARAAVEAGAVAELERLLTVHPELVRARDDGGTLLHHATGMPTLTWPPEAPEIVGLLAERGADLDAGEWRDGTGETPLIHAASVNNVPVLRRLLALGADPEKPGRHHQGIDTTLGYALFYGQDSRLTRFDRDAPAVLLEHGCRVPVPLAAALARVEPVREGLPGLDEVTRRRTLVFAAHSGQMETVAVCLETGVPPSEAVDFFHEQLTPLHAAAGPGHLDVVALLLDRGADPTVRDGRFQATALEWARHLGHHSIVDLLSSSS